MGYTTENFLEFKIGNTFSTHNVIFSVTIESNYSKYGVTEGSA